MENEKIIEKIRKTLELSRNNPSEEEAKAAALMAQKLLAKYHIDMADVEAVDLDKDEPIEEVYVDLPAKKWKYELATAVAQNFRCKHIYYGKSRVCFYGHKTDATVAADTFKYLFDLGNILAGREVDRVFKQTGTSRNVYGSFCRGFAAGIKEALGEQCQALMLVIPQDVSDSYNEMSKNFRTMCTSHTSGVYRDIYEKGKQEGRSAVQSRKLEA